MATINKSDVTNETELLEYLGKQPKSGSRLYHYTSFDSLLFILNGKAFRLSRTALLNDKKEKDFSGKHDFYVMSMTGEKEYVSMWSMYGRPSGIKVRIDFSLDLFNNCFNRDRIYQDAECKIHYFNRIGKLFLPTPAAIEDCAIKDVVYLNKDRTEYIHNERAFPSIRATESGIEQLGGFIKYDAWEFERETRARVYCDPTKVLDHVFVAITDELVSDLRVTFNPWLSTRMKEELSSSLNRWGIVCKDSGFDGQIGEL